MPTVALPASPSEPRTSLIFDVSVRDLQAMRELADYTQRRDLGHLTQSAFAVWEHLNDLQLTGATITITYPDNTEPQVLPMLALLEKPPFA